VLAHAQGNAIPATADPVWATLEPWLRTGTQPLLLLLDNGEELIKSYRGAEEAEVGITSSCALVMGWLAICSMHYHMWHVYSRRGLFFPRSDLGPSTWRSG
jgi:hypothetical protein